MEQEKIMEAEVPTVRVRMRKIVSLCVTLTELRRKTIPIFFDMMQCEFMSALPGSQQKKRNFYKVTVGLQLDCMLSTD